MLGITAEKLGKRWGQRNGFKGNKGGWIIDTKTNQVVCQGWWAFFSNHRSKIVSEILSNKN